MKKHHFKLKNVLNPRIWALIVWIWMSENLHCFSSPLYLKVLYFLRNKEKLNLEDPRTFNEKINWLKLHVNKTPQCSMMVDKYGVRDYIKDKIGEEYLIPLLGVWNTFDEIDFDKLPNEFVLKTTHDSGGIVICNNKSELDISEARKIITKHLHYNYYWRGRELPYKEVTPRIIAEKLMIDKTNKQLKDYKIFCFDGKPMLLFMASDRFSKGGVKFTYYDLNLNLLPIKSKGHERNLIPPVIPNWEEMKHLAEILSDGFPHLRVDFYNINGKIYFGELTFHHDSGIVPIEPKEWEYKLGDMIKL